VVFSQVNMLYGSLHYIFLFDESVTNYGVIGASKHYSFRKGVQDPKGASTCPFIIVIKNEYMNLKVS
tara:strand:+ start:311 stop:511 length:201 start_codon:yes stop_codon:yes gene_type:complete